MTWSAVPRDAQFIDSRGRIWSVADQIMIAETVYLILQRGDDCRTVEYGACGHNGFERI